MIQFHVLLWLLVKHFICDFPLQATPWMYKNKGTYFHPGGIVHAGIHWMGTFVVLSFFTTPQIAMVGGFLDFTLHYHIDWAKMNICSKLKLEPTNSEWFWILLGFDQLLHNLTYVYIASKVR